jgi:DKNYY family
MKKFPLWVLLMGLLSFLFGCSDSGYSKKQGRWHYDGYPMAGKVSEPVNLVPIDGYFAKDDNIGYYRGVPVYSGQAASDGASFEVVSKYYAKDKWRVYFCDTERDSKEYWSIKRTKIKAVPLADTATFRLLSDGFTARDEAHVYSGMQVIPVRDVASYQTLDNLFAKDRMVAYYRYAVIGGSDGGSFVVLNRFYGKDQSNVFFVDAEGVARALKGARLAFFTPLGDGYATDDARAYYRGRVIATTHSETLQTFGEMGYAKTSHQVFYNGELLPDADAATFKLADPFNPRYDGLDRLGYFSTGRRIDVSH